MSDNSDNRDIDDIKEEHMSNDAEYNSDVRADDGSDSDEQVIDIDKTDIGHILVSDPYNPAVGAGDSQVYFYVDPNSRAEVGIGSYLGSELVNQKGDSKYIMLGRINRLKYAYNADINDRKKGGSDRDYRESNLSYIGNLTPISKVEISDDSVTQQIVDRPPRPNQEVSVIKDKEVLETGLRIPKEGDFAGNLAVSGEVIPDPEDPLIYRLSNPNATDGNSDDGEPQMFRHTLVSGKTGTGKTHFSKNILRQFSECKRFKVESDDKQMKEPRLNLTIFDPENEYIKMRNDNPDIPSKFKKKLEPSINVGGIEESSSTDFNVWVPSVETDSPAITGSEEFCIPFSIVKERPSLIIPADPGEQTERTIRKLVREYFDSLEDNSEATYLEFVEWSEKYLETHDINDNVRRAARSRINDETMKNVFDKSGKPLDEASEEIFGNGMVSVIPLKHLGGTEELVVLSILSFVVDNKISAEVNYPHIKETPLLLALDEAHKYLSGTDRIRKEYVVNRFRKAARRGRKDKFGLFLVTQNPTDIDEIVRNQINTQIFLELGEDIVDSRGINIPSDYKSRITTLDKGEAIINAPDTRPVEVKGLRYCLTEH